MKVHRSQTTAKMGIVIPPNWWICHVLLLFGVSGLENTSHGSLGPSALSYTHHMIRFELSGTGKFRFNFNSWTLEVDFASGDLHPRDLNLPNGLKRNSPWLAVITTCATVNCTVQALNIVQDCMMWRLLDFYPWFRLAFHWGLGATQDDPIQHAMQWRRVYIRWTLDKEESRSIEPRMWPFSVYGANTFLLAFCMMMLAFMTVSFTVY